MSASDNNFEPSEEELLWADKVDSAKQSFKEVLASDEHEDGKAQRILTAMAFLTAAGCLIFAELNHTGIASSIKFPLGNHAYVQTTFFAFIVTMVIGTLFFLAALGPAFNIPEMWRKKDKKPYPKSLLFSQLIIQDTLKEWENYWKESSEKNLRIVLSKNYVTEAYLLAQKVRFKVSYMRWGKLVYKFSLGFLSMLVIPLLTTDIRQVSSLAEWFFAAVFVQDILERATSPGIRPFATSNLILTLIELILALALILMGILKWIS